MVFFALLCCFKTGIVEVPRKGSGPRVQGKDLVNIIIVIVIAIAMAIVILFLLPVMWENISVTFELKDAISIKNLKKETLKYATTEDDRLACQNQMEEAKIYYKTNGDYSQIADDKMLQYLLRQNMLRIRISITQPPPSPVKSLQNSLMEIEGIHFANTILETKQYDAATMPFILTSSFSDFATFPGPNENICTIIRGNSTYL